MHSGAGTSRSWTVSCTCMRLIAISGLRSRQGRHDEAITLARESVALLARSDFIVSLQLAHLALARALRMAADERGARAGRAGRPASGR